MSFESSGNERLLAYLRTAFRRRYLLARDVDAGANAVLRTLGRMELDDPGLTRRIADKLADPAAFQGSPEQRLLQMAIASASGEEPSRSGRTREVPLGELEIASGDESDPAAIVDRAERMGVLRTALIDAIKRLPPRQQTILTEIYLEGKSQAEVSRDRDVDRRRIHDEHRNAIEALARQIGHLRDLYTPGR